MAHQLLLFTGGILGSDSQPTPSTAVERDSTGSVYHTGVNASDYVSAGGMYVAKQTVSTTATASASATVVEANASSAAFTLTLQPVSAAAGQWLILVKTDSSANVVTVKGNGSDNINGANTYAGLSAQWDAVRLYCDGTQWIIV